MTDTGCVIPADKQGRLAANYTWQDDRLIVFDDPATSRYLQSGRLLSGGAGLVSTARDYMRFLRLILNGGTLEGANILSSATIRLMLANHFPKADSGDMSRPDWMRQPGHGLGFALNQNPTRAGNMADWAGAAPTFFWVDRALRLAAVFMTQRTPLEGAVLPGWARRLTYQALGD